MCARTHIHTRTRTCTHTTHMCTKHLTSIHVVLPKSTHPPTPTPCPTLTPPPPSSHPLKYKYTVPPHPHTPRTTHIHTPHTPHTHTNTHNTNTAAAAAAALVPAAAPGGLHGRSMSSMQGWGGVGVGVGGPYGPRGVQMQVPDQSAAKKKKGPSDQVAKVMELLPFMPAQVCVYVCVYVCVVCVYVCMCAFMCVYVYVCIVCVYVCVCCVYVCVCVCVTPCGGSRGVRCRASCRGIKHACTFVKWQAHAHILFSVPNLLYSCCSV